jgi:hypothetical protein
MYNSKLIYLERLVDLVGYLGPQFTKREAWSFVSSVFRQKNISFRKKSRLEWLNTSQEFSHVITYNGQNFFVGIICRNLYVDGSAIPGPTQFVMARDNESKFYYYNLSSLDLTNETISSLMDFIDTSSKNSVIP